MNGIHRTSSQIMEALNEWGDETRFCSECKEFFPRGDNAHKEHDRYSYDDIRDELEEAFIGEQEAFGKFITRITEALGLKESFGGGFEEEKIISAINALKDREIAE
jgi:hypothetical protein